MEKISKDQRQEEWGQKWRYSAQHGADRNGRGVLEAVGGFGKTYSAVTQNIRPHLEVSKDHTCIVLVPREPLVKQWNEEIRRNISPEFTGRINVFTVQSMQKNNAKSECTLLVVDELSEFFDSDRAKYIDGTMIKFKFNAGFTAIYRTKSGSHKKFETLWPVIDRIPAPIARLNGWISRMCEYNWPIELPTEDVTKYNSMCDSIEKLQDTYGGFDAINSFITPRVDALGLKVQPIVKVVEFAKSKGWNKFQVGHRFSPDNIFNDAKTYFALLRERKSFLNEHHLKMEKAYEIISKFYTLRTIMFGESTKFVDDFSAYLSDRNIPSVMFHSNISSRPLINTKTGQFFTTKGGKVKVFGKTSLKKMALQAIKTGEVKVLLSASALDVGFDEAKIRIGIATSRNSNSSKQRQRGFRVVRVDPYDPNAQCIIVNIYFSKTQDERWLKSAQTGLPHPVRYIHSVEDIIMDDGINLDDL